MVRRSKLLAASFGLGIGAAASPAAAASFTTDDGWQINLDTTLAAGVTVRASPRDPRFIGLQNGGYAVAPTQDNGTLNFAPGSVTAAPLRATEEVQIKRDDYGVFVRAFAFYDPVYDGTFTPSFMPFPRAAARDLGADARLLDAYAFGAETFAGTKISWRLGNQAINWGESTFIPGGINSFSPFDANALESPGAELREAVLPVPAADVRIGITPALSLEAVYEFAWIRTRFEPIGSYFSVNDTLSDGATFIPIDPALPDTFAGQNHLYVPSNDVFGGAIPRGVDRHPEDSGEFALALRYLAPFMNNAEFGLYFENFHSRTPFVDFTTGTATAVKADEALLLGRPGYTFDSTASYRADYPDNIKLLGASFSTTVLDGVELQGEISHRFNQPLLLNTLDGIQKIVGPFLCDFSKFLAGFGLVQQAAQAQASCVAARNTAIVPLTGGFPGFGTSWDNWKRYPVTQIQATATRIMDPIPSLGISSWTVVGEIGVNHVEDFPHDRLAFDPTIDNARDAPGPAIIALSAAIPKGLITQTAAGTVVLVTADVPDLLPHGVDLQPNVALSYDFAGRDAVGAGYFEQGDAAISIGASLIWLSNYKLDIAYTNHFGIGPTSGDPLVDRDFVSAALSMTF
jgi:hypothetical protein